MVHILPQQLLPPYRGFAGCPLKLKWLPMLLIFLGFSHFFHHFEVQGYQMFYCNNHCHYSDLIANQACYAFQHVLSPEQK